ncbi:MAG: hypothetical protein U0694_06860 [Anaerolineae bacterium]
MLNYRVTEDLSAVIEALKQEGVEIEMEPIENKHGRFAWIRDLKDTVLNCGRRQKTTRPSRAAAPQTGVLIVDVEIHKSDARHAVDKLRREPSPLYSG